MYTVAATTSARAMPRTERLCALAFAPSKGLLAAGAEGGGLYLWRRHAGTGGGGGGSGSGSGRSGSALWEPVYSNTLPAGIVALAFAGRSGALVVQLANQEVWLLSEATLRRKTAGDVAIVQTSNHEAIIERRGAASPADVAAGVPGGAAMRAPVWLSTLRTALNIRGVDATAKTALAWSGKVCEVYAVGEGAPATNRGPGAAGSGSDAASPHAGAGAGAAAPTAAAAGGSGGDAGKPPTLRLTSSFAVDALDMAIAGDGIYSCAQGSVLVHNAAGTVKHTLTFPEADGTPCLLDTNGRFMAVATTGE